MNKITFFTGILCVILGTALGLVLRSGDSDKTATDPPKATIIEDSEPGEKPWVQPAGYSLSPETIDFGKLREGQAVDFQVTLKHPGKEDVRIGRISTTCPCVGASAEKMIIPSDEDGTIKINYHSLTANGKKHDHFFVELLKPEKVTLRGTVIGTVKRVPSQIMLEPAVLHFGSVSESQVRPLKLWNLTKQAIRVTLTDAGGLACDVTGNIQTVMPGKSVEIQMTADPGLLDKGSLQGTITLSTSLDLHKTVTIPFDGAVR